MSYFFQLNTLKGTAKGPAVDLWRLNTPRGTNTAFFTSNRYDENPCPFHKGPTGEKFSNHTGSNTFSSRSGTLSKENY